MKITTSALFFLFLSLFKNLVASDELAKFETGVNSLCMGHSFFIKMCEQMNTYVNLNKYPGHVYNKVSRGGINGSPRNLWDDEKEKIKQILETGNIDLLMMTIHTETVLDDYVKWIDFAKSYNPNTAIFIGIPWAPNGPTRTTQAYNAQIEFYDKPAFGMVEELRDLYQDTPIYYLNYGHVAAKMRVLFDQDALEDIKKLCCTTQNSIFRDQAPGHQGKMLRDVTALLWLKFFYADTSVTLPNYNTEDVNNIIAYAQTKHIGKNDQTLISQISILDTAANNLLISQNSILNTAANNLSIFLSSWFP